MLSDSEKAATLGESGGAGLLAALAHGFSKSHEDAKARLVTNARTAAKGGKRTFTAKGTNEQDVR